MNIKLICLLFRKTPLFWIKCYRKNISTVNSLFFLRFPDENAFLSFFSQIYIYIYYYLFYFINLFMKKIENEKKDSIFRIIVQWLYLLLRNRRKISRSLVFYKLKK